MIADGAADTIEFSITYVVLFTVQQLQGSTDTLPFGLPLVCWRTGSHRTYDVPGGTPPLFLYIGGRVLKYIPGVSAWSMVVDTSPGRW